MAYINVAEWSPDQVTDWLKGLDDAMYNYVYAFSRHEINGHQLLNVRPYELEQLGMYSIGHQEIVLEAVENLRNFHYNLDKENLQFMALHVATAARSLHRQLTSRCCGAAIIETRILNDITRTIDMIKPLIGWLDRAPFQGQFQFSEICRKMLRLGLEMATIAQRERFVENPVQQIRSTAETLERLANYIIQDITDPMLLQPASLNLVTLKKRESELGFNIETSYHGIHRITDIKHNSPAHNSGKIEDGDEIVQINYQTVVGWQYKSVLMQLRESLPDVLLTLKKRPKHTKIYGQIYMQPYRLPSKKRSVGSRWGENCISSPRPCFLPSSNENTFKETTNTLKTVESGKNTADDADTDSISSDILTPTDNKSSEKENRLYYPKPRTMLQRRNTICGDGYFGHRNVAGMPTWHERKTGNTGEPTSPSLRDKSVSFGFGLEISSRPTTCIGISSSTRIDENASNLCDRFVGNNASLMHHRGLHSSRLHQVLEQPHEEQELYNPQWKPGVSKVVHFDAQMKMDDYPVNEKYVCNVENTILETFEPIPFADDEDEEIINTLMTEANLSTNSAEQTPQHNTDRNSLGASSNASTAVRRGRLDKSHSTPTYDTTADKSDQPPAIEPRKEFLSVIPPVPPPRPRKQSDVGGNTMPVPVPPPKPPGLLASLGAASNVQQSNQSPVNCRSPAIIPSATVTTVLTTNEIDNKSIKSSSTLSLASSPNEKTILTTPSEVHTPAKARSLTLKKKHSLIAKRRNVNLKILGTGDIQGHLYRRTKDKRGVTFWARLYFVMLDTMLYGFRSKESSKASCVIFLPGFTVSLAKEVHSKPFAFKVYHSAKTFYFAAESQDALSQWVDFIGQGSMSTNSGACGINAAMVCNSTDPSQINIKDLYSENESSSEENESVINKNLCTPSPQNLKDVTNTSNALSSPLGTTPPTATTTASTTKNDRRYLGSLRKLTKGSLTFKNSSSNEKKIFNTLPVPTEQFRSYRKVPGGSFGLQIGTNVPGYHHDSNLKTTPVLQQNANKNADAINVESSFGLPGHQTNVVPNVTQSQSQSQSLNSDTKNTCTASNAQSNKIFELPTNSSQNIINNNNNQGTLKGKESLNNVQINSTNSMDLNLTESETGSIITMSPSNSSKDTTITTTIATVSSSTTLTSGNLTDNKQIPTSSNEENCDAVNNRNNVRTQGETGRYTMRKIPYNFIHASNPNLVEFDFQTSKTFDYVLPKINSTNAWDTQPINIQGFVTLKDLMLQKQEEEAQEMYNNRVLLGVEKKDERRHRTRNSGEMRNANEDNGIGNANCPGQSTSTLSPMLGGNMKLVKTQSRSLPKPPDYEISFKPDDVDIQLTRTKEGLKLRDFGYELISGDEPNDSSTNSAVHNNNSSGSGIGLGSGDLHENIVTGNGSILTLNSSNWPSSLKNRHHFLLNAHKSKKYSTNNIINSYVNADSSTGLNGIIAGSGKNDKRTGSFKKKGKLESFKTSSERIFQFGKQNSNNNNNNVNQSNIGGTSSNTMTLPLHKKSSQNLIEKANGSGSCSATTGIKKSRTYNQDLKEKITGKYEAHRKNSAPMPIFAKLSFSGNISSSSGSGGGGGSNSFSSKERKLLGSPLLHRTVFGMRSSNATISSGNGTGGNTSYVPTRDYDQEIFSQVIFPKVTPKRKQLSAIATGTSTTTSLSTTPTTLSSPTNLLLTTSNSNVVLSAPEMNAPPPPKMVIGLREAQPINIVSGGAEHSNMECAPVFESDIYSLSGSNSNLLLRRHQNNNNHNNNNNNNNNTDSDAENILVNVERVPNSIINNNVHESPSPERT